MMDPTIQNELSPTRLGASADPQAAPSSLPMIVWLRGDEPYCEDFRLGADEVMVQLGIKRSRLTQISGQELRVGRLRQGRYIKPVFRQSDVDEYKTWVRPTASHVKSKQVVEQAQQKLESTLDDMAEVLLQVGPSLEGPLARLDMGLSSRLQQVAKLLEHRIDLRGQQSERMLTGKIQEMTDAWRAGNAELTEAVNTHQRELLMTLATTSEHIQTLAMALSHLDQRCATLATLAKAQHQALEHWQQQAAAEKAAELATEENAAPRKPRRVRPKRSTFRAAKAEDGNVKKFLPPRKPRRR